MCSICRHSPCLRECPNYNLFRNRPYCSNCGGQIQVGENYIKNIDCEYMHFECIRGIRQLLSWLGYEIEEME